MPATDMRRRVECATCALGASSHPRKVAVLCGGCRRSETPHSFCIVEKHADAYAWTLLRSDSRARILFHLKQLAFETDAGEFAVLRWVPRHGYREATLVSASA